jgi:amino acid adenylation domain-containing protein
MRDKKSLAERLAELSPEQKQAMERLIRARAARASDLKRRAAGERAPLSYGQQRLWLLDQLSPANPAYNETNSLRFRFALDPDVFRRAVNEVVRRHEVLRMSVQVIDGKPFLRVAPFLSLNIPLIDLRHMPPAEREPHAMSLAAEQSRLAFDLGEGPLIRCSLLRLGDKDYLFVQTAHHMVIDGWSWGVMTVELAANYYSFLFGNPSPLPELEIQYGDYAIWQRRALSPGSKEGQLAYWREQLRALPTLQLPTDRPRPAEFTFRGERQRMEIAGGAYASLTERAERKSVTLFMVLFAVFAVMLHRYTEQEDVVVGVPSSGRSRTELEPLIGFFVNTLIMRVKVASHDTFDEVLEHVRRVSMEAYSNQDVPYERLVEELRPERDKSRNPLFQVSFQLFERPSDTGLRKDFLLPYTPVDSGIAKFDLLFELIWTEERIQGLVEYNTDLFDAGRIRRMIAHYHRLIEQVTAAPSTRVSALAMLTPEEEKQLLEWNRTATPYPKDRTITQVFSEQAGLTPDAPAVEFEGRTLNYRELRERAASVAARLASRGVRPGDFVGLYLSRSIDVPAALLGILEAGAAYVPLDPNYPKERLAYLLADSGVKCVLTTLDRAGGLAEFGKVVIAIDDTAAETHHSALPGGDQSPESVAYVMYTSGTTGRPKGVAVTHRNILRLVKNVGYVNLDAGQTVLQFAPISFDASTFEIWGCLLNGGRLAIYPPGGASAEELGEFIKTERISLLFITTALFIQMIEYCAADLRDVKQVITGGEVLPVAVAQAAWRALPRSRIFNAYGPTESTAFATIYEIRRPEAIVHSVPIGKPIDNTTAYVFDPYGNLTPLGVPGELYIGGDGVAAGYWGSAELTGEKFVPDPFRPEGRLYRTGDVACFREDGNLLFLGRRDRQVKLSGYRVEPGEVESAILSHPDVRAAVVMPIEKDGKRLSAFCEVHDGKTLSLADLRDYLSQRLPHYMLPSQLTMVDSLPLTPNGKTDMKALASLWPGASVQGGEYLAPRNPREQTLSEMWSELLQTERVGVRNNFFELGGQSLVATRLLSRIRNEFDVQVTMREFFDRPTIEGLAEFLDQRMMPGE